MGAYYSTPTGLTDDEKQKRQIILFAAMKLQSENVKLFRNGCKQLDRCLVKRFKLLDQIKNHKFKINLYKFKLLDIHQTSSLRSIIVELGYADKLKYQIKKKAERFVANGRSSENKDELFCIDDHNCKRSNCERKHLERFSSGTRKLFTDQQQAKLKNQSLWTYYAERQPRFVE
jgi:hypothetical protein